MGAVTVLAGTGAAARGGSEQRAKPRVRLIGPGRLPLLGVEWVREDDDALDAVVVDGREGWMEDGALSQLLQGAQARGLPVLFLSGPKDAERTTRAFELGAEDVLFEPLGERELYLRMSRAIFRQRQKEKLLAQAQTDPLTGLANFGALQARLEDEFHRAHRYGHNIAVVMVDLDHLKTINDRFGHGAGNGAILALADTLKENLRQTDFAGRFGGDEFAVILPYQGAAEAAVFAERVRAGLRRLVPLTADDPQPMMLSLSAGVSAHSDDSPKRSAAALLAAADQALYAAKKNGRDQVAVSSDATFDQASGEEADVAAAVRNDEASSIPQRH